MPAVGTHAAGVAASRAPDRWGTGSDFDAIGEGSFAVPRG